MTHHEYTEVVYVYNKLSAKRLITNEQKLYTYIVNYQQNGPSRKWYMYIVNYQQNDPSRINGNGLRIIL